VDISANFSALVLVRWFFDENLALSLNSQNVIELNLADHKVGYFQRGKVSTGHNFWSSKR
jgi:hypothetical protein